MVSIELNRTRLHCWGPLCTAGVPSALSGSPMNCRGPLCTAGVDKKTRPQFSSGSSQLPAIPTPRYLTPLASEGTCTHVHRPQKACTHVHITKNKFEKKNRNERVLGKPPCRFPLKLCTVTHQVFSQGNNGHTESYTRMLTAVAFLGTSTGNCRYHLMADWLKHSKPSVHGTSC